MLPFFAHKPQSMSEFVGQDESLKKIDLFFSGFKKGKGLFLYGPPGVGKTSSIHAYAKEHKYELLELNASDARNKSDLEDFLSKATGQMSLFATKKIILLDEVDGLSGTKDRGATTSIAQYIAKSQFPIVVTGIDVFDKKFSSLKKSCELVEFKQLSPTSITLILQNACSRSKVVCSNESLKLIARQASGDARAGLNDLFSFTVIKNSNIQDLGVRKQTEKIASALIKVFKSTDPEVVFGSFDDVDEDLDKIFLWLDHNIPIEYLRSADLAKAYDVLSLADRFYGRIRRWQYYRFYVYCYVLLSVGIALSKEEKYSSPPMYKQPSRLLKYWQANMAYAKRKSVVEKLATAQKISYKECLKTFPTLLPALASTSAIHEELVLADDEIAWLKKQKHI
jgi:replication factor C large subunit